MDETTAETLTETARRDAATAVLSLAAAETAVGEGRLNLAKVLRASALALRTRSLVLERLLAAESTSLAAFEAVREAEAASAAALESLLSAAVDPSVQRSLRIALDVSQSLSAVLEKTRASLESNRDVLESEVAQFLWGCQECGLVVEQGRPEICPACGSIAGEFEMFAPFFSATSERIMRRQPAEIEAMLQDDPARLVEALAGADDELLRRKPSAEEWCIKEIAGHMVDIAALFCRRLRALLEPETAQAAERTPMPWMLIHGQGYPEMTAEAICERFERANDDALALIGRLAGKDWRKKAEMAGGRVAVIDMGSWLANHNVAHMEQIRALRATLEG